MRMWLVYTPGSVVEFHGLFRRLVDAQGARDTERENLRAAGSDRWDEVAIERFLFEPRAVWSS